MHVRYIHHTPWWRTLTTPQRQTDRGRFACLRRIEGATPVVCCRLQVLLRVLLGVVVLLAGQLWICLYLFMLMRKKTKIKEKEPQLIKHLHAHKSFTCILYLVDFLSCRYTHRLCLFSLPCSKQNFLLLLFVSKKKRKKNFANSEDRRKLVRHVLTLSHLGQARQESKRRERGGDGGEKVVLKQFAKRILNDF